MSNNNPKWFDDYAELAYLATAMQADGYSVTEIIRMLEKPWKWWKEYRYAQAHSGSLEGFDTDVSWPESVDNAAADSAMDDVGEEEKVAAVLSRDDRFAQE